MAGRTTAPRVLGGWSGSGWPRAFRVIVPAAFLVGGLLACSDSTGPDQGDDEFDLVLRPESTLFSGCFGWPAEEFSPANNTGGVGVSVSAGEQAIEFTLKDPDGASHTLSELLGTRPVLLVFGGFT